MGDVDRLKASLAAYVRSLFSGIDYLALYPAKVVVQNADGSLELQPDSSRLPGLSQVPVRLGVPGVTVKVLPGARVLVGFAEGDPSQPIAEVWESGSLLQLNLNATTISLNSGVLATARVTDPVLAGPYGGSIIAGNPTVLT